MTKKRFPAAAALKYSANKDSAPKVVASGKGKTAEKIMEIAKQAEIPIVEDAALVSALLALEMGDEIPESLYRAVAKVLSFIYTLDSEIGKIK